MAEGEQGPEGQSDPGAGVGDNEGLVATYDRVIKASIERIWENVLDWEHLPWLHSGSFASIEIEHEDEGGWRATVGVGPRGFASPSRVEVKLDRPNSCYTTTTLAGLGEGTEIRTALAPVGANETAIKVEFIVPGISEDDVEGVGAIYLDLYRQLWDEDEVMMMHRQSMIDERASSEGPRDAMPESVLLGAEADLRNDLPMVVDAGGYRIRVVEVDGALVAHDVVCPHLGGPLEDTEVESGVVTCPWHGYRFDVRSGEGRDGCSLRLRPAPAVQVDGETGEVRLVFS
jgi:nitrite reductase/ring-hydroxylating ferredoxin subunit